MEYVDSISSSTLVISLFGAFALLLIIIIIAIIANQGKNKLMESHNDIVLEFHKANKITVESLNKEIDYLNNIKPEWNLHRIENKIRDVSYYKKTHSEIEEIVNLSYMHDKKFDDIFDDVEVYMLRYERVIESFFKKYRKHHDMVEKSFVLSKFLYNSKKDNFLEKIYEIIAGEKTNKEFLS